MVVSAVAEGMVESGAGVVSAAGEKAAQKGAAEREKEAGNGPVVVSVAAE